MKDRQHARGGERPLEMEDAVTKGIRVPTVTRSVLLDGLERVRLGSVVVLQAPHGYGKSTLIEQWASRGSLGIMRVRLTEQHRDPSVLIRALSDAAGVQMNPDADESPAIDDLLTARTQHLVGIALDDAQVLVGSASTAVVETLIKQTPRWMLLVIATTVTPAGTARAELEGRLVRLGMADLSIAASDLPSTWTDAPTARELLRLTDGWPLALKLLDERGQRATTGRLAATDLLGRYLDEEVLAHLDAEMREVLADVAELGGGDVESLQAIRAKAGLDGEVTSLLDLSLPMLTVSKIGTSVDLRMAELLVNHLVASRKLTDPQRSGRLLRAKARALQDLGDLDGAFALIRDTGDRAELARFALTGVEQLLLQGRLDTSLGWLDSFTAEEFAEYPELALTQALHTAADGRFDTMDHILSLKEGDREPREFARVRSESTSAWELLREYAGRISKPSRRKIGIKVKGWWGLVGLMNDGLQANTEGRLDYARATFETVAQRCAPYPLIDLWSTSGLAWIARHQGRLDDFDALVLPKQRILDSPGMSSTPSTFSYEGCLALALARSRSSDARVRLDSSFSKQKRLRGGFVNARLINQITLCYAAHQLGNAALFAAMLDHAHELANKHSADPFLQSCIADLDRLAVGGRTQPTVLSISEQRILALLPTHMTVPEIAQQLGLSPNTVRTHTNAIYRKLGVHGRTEAVVTAQDIGLI